MNTVISVLSGTDVDWNGTATISGTSTPYTGFINSDTISAVVYPGENQPITFSPTATWVSAPGGTYRISFLAANTSSVTPGRYIFRVVVTRASDSRIIPVAQGWIDIGDSPGSASPLTSYCSYRDLLDKAPWLNKELVLTDLSGFANHRYLARAWFEQVLQKKARALTVASGTYTTFNPGNIFQSQWDGGTNVWLKQQFDANKLMVTSQVKEINSHKSIAYICESCMGPSSSASSYQEFADRHHFWANERMKSYTGELDTAGNGYASFFIPCGIFSTR